MGDDRIDRLPTVLIKESEYESLIEAKQELADLKQKYFDMFNQACQIETEKGEIKFDHMCISSYEEAQDYLIEQGLLKPEDCYRS